MTLDPGFSKTEDTVKSLSVCYDTLEIIYDEIYSEPFFKSQLEQLDHLNNAMLIVNEWHKHFSGAEKNWLPDRDFNYPNQEKPNDSE
jgi:hypothetical protein